MFGLFAKKECHLVINTKEPMLLAARETILNAALRNDINFPHSCKVGGCGSCKCRLLEGSVKEFTDKSYLLTREEMDQNYILACQSMPKTNVVIEIPDWDETAHDVRGCISNIEALTHDISKVSVALDEPMNYKAGQYASISAAGTDIPPRCYSFATKSGADGSRNMYFFVRAVAGGAMSNWLIDTANKNSAVTLSAPNGDFYLRDAPQPVLCIAGGSGLAPIMAVLEEAVQNNSAIVDQPLTLLLGVRAQRDVYYQQQINDVAAQWRNDFNFLPVLSDEPIESDWRGLRGMVTEYINEENSPGAKAYLCGPPPMIDAAIEKMQGAGMDVKNIFFDKFLDQSGVKALS